MLESQRVNGHNLGRQSPKDVFFLFKLGFVSFHPEVLKKNIVKDFQLSTNQKPRWPS